MPILQKVKKVQKQDLYSMIDAVDISQYNLLLQILMKFVPSDIATNEEVNEIQLGRADFAAGRYKYAEDIDWNAP